MVQGTLKSPIDYYREKIDLVYKDKDTPKEISENNKIVTLIENCLKKERG